MSLPRSLGPIARLLDQNLPFPVFLRQAHTDHLQYTLFTRLRAASSQNSCRHFSTESPGSGSLEFHRVGDSAVVQPPSVTRAQEAGGQQRQQSYEGIDTKQLILQAALKRVVSNHATALPSGTGLCCHVRKHYSLLSADAILMHVVKISCNLLILLQKSAGTEG